MQTRKLAYIIYTLLIGVIFISCKKQTTIEDQSADKNKILSFIQSSTNLNSSIPVEEISIALSETNLQFETTENSREKLAVAKLKRPLSIINEKSDNSLYLIAFYEPGETIRKVKFVSYDNLGLRNFTDLPKNTLNNVINIGTNDIDGLFKFYSVEGKFQFQLNFTGGRLGAVGNVTHYPKNTRMGGAGIVSQTSSSLKQKGNWMYECSDVYLVTSYYDASGNYLYQTREFLYRQGNCSGPGEVQVPQPDEGGGGGFPEEYEYARLKITQWSVGNLPNFLPTGSDGAVTSWENIRGKKVSTDPQGGHFTSIVHNSDECRCGSIVWFATSTSGTASAQTATATVKGGASWAGNYYTLENSAVWSFSQIFP
ncbi:hypothetical protein [Sediminibacterium goheungense]|uniref:Lipoprotein n=1 Tax=Sediminibacterium goheungense TaxID=1086393 RepID=A0A4R6IWM9_9BACT|nr:hypothetical protein [Sediminibacterium goheungense]TDO26787.1 hypothetical protein BC659_2099 [Sediminibacterium goheungense]